MAGGVIIGGSGIGLLAGGVVTDAGVIIGTSGPAVTFGGSGNNLLELKSGYHLVGGVQGGVSARNTVELVGSIGAGVTVDYAALGLTNFQNVLFGPGGNATLRLIGTSGVLPVTISGMGSVSDVIDLTAIGTNGTISAHSATGITVTGSLGSVTLVLDGSDATGFATFSDGAGGTELVACFRRGTRILTAAGEIAVEDLAIGNRVVTVSGDARPIKWIGLRAYDPRFVAGNRTVLPVRIAAGAFGDGLPARDLWLSPEHALYLDGVLIAAGLLINSTTIVQPSRVDSLEYFHIELESHDILLAEGLPAESYVERNNRGMFHNAAEFANLYPEIGSEVCFCAPRLEADSPELAEIRATIAVGSAARAA